MFGQTEFLVPYFIESFPLYVQEAAKELNVSRDSEINDLTSLT
jgi:hypothetical protein